MNTNIEILTINKYFTENKEKKLIKKNRSTIVKYSYLSINEATISHKISQIPYYSNFFSILEYYEPLNVSQLNEDFYEKLNIEENQYYLFKYSDKNCINFIDYIYSSISIKKLIFDVINSFSHILNGLHILNENNLCFFNISTQNIIYLENYREKPVLKNFRYSLQLNKLDCSYFSNILNNLNDFTYQPIEIHIIYYLINNTMITISYSFIEEFCENYIKNLNILNLFSENYKKKYKEECIVTMKKYINKPKKEIMNDILERNDKWDVYGISMIYLQIFGCISRIFSLKGTFISKITLELSKNLHPDSDKRMSLDNTLNIFNRLLNEENNWDFINKLDNRKLIQLFDEFSK